MQGAELQEAEQRVQRFGPGWWIKLFGLGVLDAIVVALIPSLIEQGARVALVSMVVGAIGVNYIFLSAKTYPLRWLVPGMTFLTLFMIWPIIFTVFIATTNWSTGHFISKPQAIERITEGTRYLLAGDNAPVTELYFYRDAGAASDTDPLAGLTVLVVTDLGEQFYGDPRLSTEPAPEETELLDLSGLEVVDEDGDGVPEQIGAGTKLRLIDIGSITPILDRIVLDIPERGQARARTFSSAVLAEQRYGYDEERDLLIDRLTGVECPIVEGAFVCEGQVVDPGWRAVVGMDNFADIVANERIRGPFLRIFTWNLIFALAVVIGQLALGLGLALTLQDRRLKGKGIYRSLLIVSYAAPGFIVVLIWKGLLNPSFGPVNRMLSASWLTELSNSGWKWVAALVVLGLLVLTASIAKRGFEERTWLTAIMGTVLALGTAWFLYTLVGPGFEPRQVRIPWLQPGDWFWSKMAVILVTVWQGFPYFFLISTGALQAIPSELQEAARVDGASSPQVFRKVTFPLLMVGIAPLVIASFAYNFNAFINVLLLTDGGPPVTGYDVAFGETDILISFIFDLAVAGGRGGQFALAAAATFFIFFIVAAISAISFRFTRRLENIYGNL